MEKECGRRDGEEETAIGKIWKLKVRKREKSEQIHTLNGGGMVSYPSAGVGSRFQSARFQSARFQSAGSGSRFQSAGAGSRFQSALFQSAGSGSGSRLQSAGSGSGSGSGSRFQSARFQSAGTGSGSGSGSRLQSAGVRTSTRSIAGTGTATACWTQMNEARTRIASPIEFVM